VVAMAVPVAEVAAEDCGAQGVPETSETAPGRMRRRFRGWRVGVVMLVADESYPLIGSVFEPDQAATGAPAEMVLSRGAVDGVRQAPVKGESLLPADRTNFEMFHRRCLLRPFGVGRQAAPALLKRKAYKNRSGAAGTKPRAAHARGDRRVQRTDITGRSGEVFAFPHSVTGKWDITADPRVSIILPYYEGPRWIGRSAASALGQQGIPFELILVDDGSTEPAEPHVHGLRDDRLRCLRIDHAGKGAALNAGAARARADLLCFIDQDDIMLPGRLERQVRAMCSNRFVDAVYSDYERVHDDGRFIDRFVSRQASGPECLKAMATDLALVTMQTIMIRREAFFRIGGFSEDPLLTGLDDAEFFTRLFVSGAALHYEPGAVQQWVRHDRNYSQSEQFQEARLVLLEHLRRLAGRHREVRDILGRFTHDVHYMRGIYFLENDRRREALPEFRRALRSYPFFPNTYYLFLKSWLSSLEPASGERTGVSRVRKKPSRHS